MKLVESTGAFSPTWADVGDGVGVRVYQKGVGFTFKGVALSPVAPRMRALAQVDGRPWVGEIQASDGSLISSELFNDYGVDPMALAVSPITGDLMVVGADAFNYPTSYFSTTLILKGQDGP